MKFLPYDNKDFLEPAHDHDPGAVSHLTNLPQSISDTLPSEGRKVLPALQEATSIVFASYTRLQILLGQRFERLIVLPAEHKKEDAGKVQCK